MHSYRVQGLVAVALAVERGVGGGGSAMSPTIYIRKKQGSFVWGTGLRQLLSLCFNTLLKLKYIHSTQYVYYHYHITH